MNTSLAALPEEARFDVVVIGSGGAGLSAALCAAIDGARVLVVERTSHLGGTTALSAGTTWVPCTEPGLKVQPDDTLARASRFLDLAVGERSDRRLRQAFLDNGPAAVAKLAHHSDVQYQVRALHPDYLSELEGAALRGRAIEPIPFDGRLLGAALSLIRPPIPEFTVLGGMMVDRDDIFHLLRLTQSWASFKYALRIIIRHARDRLFWPRGTRLVMGNALIGRLLLSLLKRGVQIVTDTELSSLIQQGSAIQGVVLTQSRQGQTVQRKVLATGGVVLASGGFNRHPQRRSEMLPGAHPDWSPAAPGHTGQALDLALQAGAALGEGGLSHAFWAPVSIRRRADGSTAAFPHFVMDRGKPGMLTVNQAGRRFLNESTSYHLFGIEMQKQADSPSVPCWLICDAAALKRYGLGMVRPGGRGLAPFLADGYLIQANTVAALARQLQMEATVLQATLSEFNAMADQGIDTQFNRGTTDYQRANGDANWPGPNPCLGALREAPYYAIRLYPGDIGAATGLRTDTHARVLNAEGEALPGLYACGNEMHSIMGGVYPAPGITIGPGLVYGYLAAQHAMARAQSAR
ncbi:MAG: FAD-dependent oxidoreductase [Limnohabitans sp.]|nr:FAD-dependent oxidoreductase [Limnohabitans sp.]